MYYNIVARLFVIGIVPLTLLIWYNLQISKILKRRALKNSGAQHCQHSHLPKPLIKAITGDIIAVARSNGCCNGSTGSALKTNSSRTLEDQLAQIFLVIITIFLVCHSLRVFLAFHEMWTINDTVHCTKVHLSVFPFWSMIVSQVSHVFLVINSSGNLIVYCVMSPKIRGAFLDKAIKIGWIKRVADTTTNQMIPLAAEQQRV